MERDECSKSEEECGEILNHDSLPISAPPNQHPVNPLSDLNSPSQKVAPLSSIRSLITLDLLLTKSKQPPNISTTIQLDSSSISPLLCRRDRLSDSAAPCVMRLGGLAKVPNEVILESYFVF